MILLLLVVRVWALLRFCSSLLFLPVLRWDGGHDGGRVGCRRAGIPLLRAVAAALVRAAVHV